VSLACRAAFGVRSSTWKNITPRREHRERAQPNYRANMGLLEKHKDYVKRAKDFNSKKEKLKDLKRKAEERNPDEYYFRMVKSRTKVRQAARVLRRPCGVTIATCLMQEGIHVVTHSDNLTADMLKVLKTQDAGYVQTKCSAEEKVRIVCVCACVVFVVCEGVCCACFVCVRVTVRACVHARMYAPGCLMVLTCDRHSDSRKLRS
jgi:hypothetical protein